MSFRVLRIGLPNSCLARTVVAPADRRPRERYKHSRLALESLEPRQMLSRDVSFGAPIDFSTGATPSAAAFNAVSGDQIQLSTRLQNAVATGDFNGDGKADVAETNPIANSVTVFLGDGNGSFAPAQVYLVGITPLGVAVGDFNTDQIEDLAVVDAGSNNVGVLLGRGDGSFAPARFFGVGNTPVAIAVGEFDGDAIPDLAVANKADGSVSILSGNGDGTIGLATTIETPRNSVGNTIPVDTVIAGAFQGDESRQDLVLGCGVSFTGDHVLVYLNHDGSFGKGLANDGSLIPDQSVTVGGRPGSIAVADLTRDGNLDLAVGNQQNVSILLGDGKGGFLLSKTLDVGSVIRTVAIADLSGDGRAYIVTANFGSNTVSVVQRNGAGAFLPAEDFWAGEEPSGLIIGNFNGDRRADIVVGRIRTDQLSLLLNGSPQLGDQVRILHDIDYAKISNDPSPDHHTLDVYLPPSATASFAGEKRPFPVVMFAHGGGGKTSDKVSGSYLMRALAQQGILGSRPICARGGAAGARSRTPP